MDLADDNFEILHPNTDPLGASVAPASKEAQFPLPQNYLSDAQSGSRQFKASVYGKKTLQNYQQLFNYKQDLLRLENAPVDDKKTLAKRVFQENKHENVRSLNTPVGLVVPRAVSSTTGAIHAGQVVPTSARVADPKGEGCHLHNIYTLQLDGKEYGVIRSGVIDTKQRAIEFAQTLMQMREKIVANNPELKDKSMRVVSHQLNSFENEKDLINHQHRWLARVGTYFRRKDKKIQLAHINTPCNRFYFTTKFKKTCLEKLANILIFTTMSIVAGLKTLKSVIRFSPKLYTVTYHSEEASRRQNLDSLGCYLNWLNEDLPKQQQPAFTSLRHVDKLQDLAGELATAKGKRRREIKQDRKELRRTMRDALTADLTLLENLENNLEISKEQREAAALLRMFLSSQLDLPGKHLNRDQELLVIQLLHARLNITSAINCKSGLDRTGFVFAVKIALETLEKNGGDVFELVKNWNSDTQQFNRISAEEQISPLQSVREGVEYDKEHPERGQQVKIFRRIVLDNLIEVGLPITEISTGLRGLKWHADSKRQENLMPLNCLPSVIMIDGKLHHIVRYSQEGEVQGLTEDGKKLLCKFSAYRGS